MSSYSERHPALEPPESVLMVIADYGPNNGGWGPSAIPGLGPFIYTGSDPGVQEAAETLAEAVSQQGIEARVVRFGGRHDISVHQPRRHHGAA